MMPPYDDVEQDLGDEDSFLKESRHSVAESDVDDTSDTTVSPNSQGLLTTKRRRRRRATKRSRLFGVLTIFNHCKVWPIVLVIQVGMLLVLYQRLPIKQTRHLNGDISHIVPECELPHLVQPSNFYH
jgi:hypothetical protein